MVEKCWAVIYQTPESGSMQEEWRTGKQLKAKSSSSQSEVWHHRDDQNAELKSNFQVKTNGTSGSLNAGVDNCCTTSCVSSQPP